MGDLFLAALARELDKTQRVLPSSCLFCVPQARSLVADAAVSQDDLFSHFLTPAGSTDAAAADLIHRPGAYETLNGKSVRLVGSQVVTGSGFDEPRKVRILLSEHREIRRQQVMVLHLSRPLVGGIVLPEDPNELDVATFRRYTAMLRAFPENELVFLHLDETIAQVQKICRTNQFANRYEATLPQILREEWEYAVDEIARGGSFAEEDEDEGRGRRKYASAATSHLLQIQQVVECYLMEQLHGHIFPRVMVSCRDDDDKLARVLWQMRHYGPADFGLRKEFQCYLLEARNELVRVEKKKTPLEMLLAFKNCIDHINEGITANLKRHYHGLDGYQLTTDDVLDELLFLFVELYNLAAQQAAKEDDRERPHFPMVSVLKYVTDYHFINSNTSMLGYTIANFQVAVEYFLMKATHAESCRVCYNIGSRRKAEWNSWDEAIEEQCPQAIVPSAIQAAFTRNYSTWLAYKQRRSEVQKTANGSLDSHEGAEQNMFILGEWSEDEPAEANADDPTELCHAVDADSASSITQVSAGHRFFAAVDDEGRLYTWGDQSGGRLGYPSVQGDPRRVIKPRIVDALRGQHILQVSCGAFHTLVTDVNGHVYAWGQNARGQLGFLSHSTETTTVETPTIVADLKGMYMSSVACGEYHSLGLSSNGRVFSWGCNKFTKLGRRTHNLLDAVQPKPVEAQWIAKSINRMHRLDADDLGMPVGAVRRIAAGRDHSIAVTCAGAVFTWGRGDQGQLGHGSCMDVPEPKQVVTLADDDCLLKVSDVSAGGNFSLFLLRDGAVFLTGKDPSLPPDSADRLAPELVEVIVSSSEGGGADRVLAVSCVGVAAGESQFALVSDQGEVFASHVSEHQPPSTTESSSPSKRDIQAVAKIRGAVCARAGASHTVVLTGG